MTNTKSHWLDWLHDIAVVKTELYNDCVVATRRDGVKIVTTKEKRSMFPHSIVRNEDYLKGKRG